MRCQNCGNEIAENARFCRECGAEISFETEALVAANICPECGNSLESDALFCNSCGRKVGNNLEENFALCPKCGKKLKSNAPFCGECGTSIETKKTNANQITVSTPAKKKKDKGLIALVAILIVVIIACVSTIAVVYFKNNSAGIDNPEIEDVRIDKDEDDADILDNKIETNVDTADTMDSHIDEESDNSDYLFPSDREYINENDLMYLAKDEVALIRNEIYARHGYIFQSEPYKSYFAGKEWYIPNANFDESMFNVVERDNKDFIVKYEQKMGWR